MLILVMGAPRKSLSYIFSTPITLPSAGETTESGSSGTSRSGSRKKKSVMTASTAKIIDIMVKLKIAAAQASIASTPRYVNPSVAIGDRFRSISS